MTNFILEIESFRKIHYHQLKTRVRMEIVPTYLLLLSLHWYHILTLSFSDTKMNGNKLAAMQAKNDTGWQEESISIIVFALYIDGVFPTFTRIIGSLKVLLNPMILLNSKIGAMICYAFHHLWHTTKDLSCLSLYTVSQQLRSSESACCQNLSLNTHSQLLCCSSLQVQYWRKNPKWAWL